MFIAPNTDLFKSILKANLKKWSNTLDMFMFCKIYAVHGQFQKPAIYVGLKNKRPNLLLMEVNYPELI